ncbi:MAG: PAS domain S-box protein, partial [Thermodesulfobacteriota bacterium]|nr:PAS domain S-box protein [Thermodesulfobacteriota bacterium]
MAEEELDRYWKTVVNTIQDGIMIVDTHGRIVSVNKAFEIITGYSKDDL